MSNCVFCRIVAKEIPAAVVYEGEPGYIDLCGKCEAEWRAHGLEPAA